VLSVAVTRSYSDVNPICNVLSVLWMTSHFHIMQEIGQNQRRRVYVSSSSQDGGTSWTTLTTDNIIWLRSPDGGTGHRGRSLPSPDKTLIFAVLKQWLQRRETEGSFCFYKNVYRCDPVSRFYLVPGKWVKYCCMSVCGSVCMSARIS